MSRIPPAPVTVTTAGLAWVIVAACACPPSARASSAALDLPAAVFTSPAVAASSTGPAAHDTLDGATARRDTLQFTPVPADSDTIRVDWVKDESFHEWARASHRRQDEYSALMPRSPYGDGILTDRDQWRIRSTKGQEWPQLVGDYNRVDRLMLGLGYELHPHDPMAPRIGARWAYSFGRERGLYGVQMEQPLLGEGWLALGGSMAHWTGHPDLQQVSDLENSADLFLGRNDNRDYFDKNGFGAYLASRLGDVTTASLHWRNDEYKSLPAKGGITSLFWTSRELRDNPPIDEGQSHTLTLKFERLSRRVVRPQGGFYHHVSFERGGGPALKGDFDYSRLLADVRGVARVSPATTLSMRVVGGSTTGGRLPAQRAFTLGGFDGLRAHPMVSRRGDQVALGQLEYDVGLWRLLPHDLMDDDLHVIAFLDAGQAWSNPDHQWDLGRQHVAADGGFGLSTGDGHLSVYFAHDLQRPDSDFIVSGRIERPF
ncbi:MAG TPA: BamA/TamA family outer membrane protein [Dongiaceae bacterium]|nr:BamA/TamA family outer membrane protein [Dongiaceae bacterium]